MSTGKMLALIAVGAMASFVPDVVQASPLTEPAFVTFFSQNASGNGWRHSTGYLGTFVHWNDGGPEWSVSNISWVQAWSGGSDSVNLVTGVIFVDGPHDWDDGSLPWLPDGSIVVTVPEPSSLALVGAFVGTLALRRRVKQA